MCHAFSRGAGRRNLNVTGNFMYTDAILTIDAGMVAEKKQGLPCRRRHTQDFLICG